MSMQPMYSLWIDESERDQYLAVGGFFAPIDINNKIITQWRDMKVSLGLDEDAEVKWTLSQSHPTRKQLNKIREQTKTLCERAIELISGWEEITCIVCVMKDERDRRFRFWRKHSVRDFYCEALRYVLQRVAEEAEIQQLSQIQIVCDTPGLGNEKFYQRTIRRGRKAIFDFFKEHYKKGVDVGPGKNVSKKSLKDLGFQPSILVADATYHDMLQIADVIVGCTSAWVTSIAKDHQRKWNIEQFKLLSKRFRCRYGDPTFFGDGFILWPWQKELWTKLQQSLR